ncbi:MAG: pyridoxine 5'-phosphate synthase [Verrucomicrobiota bacterium JB023]|nr:pyridoxine 5'-phosphate synthase [Verrucomicrobiota bacterium JB023]
MSLLLGVNVDHIATLRQARYARLPDSPQAEPSPLQGAFDAQEGGADSITVHVRGDRRHMQERDAFEIREKCGLPLNLEMGNTDEMLEMALRLKPDFVCLVPETREEITTEGGLDVVGNLVSLRETIAKLQNAGVRISLFIDPEAEQVVAAKDSGAEMIELHTGAFANASGDERGLEKTRLQSSAIEAHDAGLQVNAGHGINYENIGEVLQIKHLTELNIGHSIVARAMRVGMSRAVSEMKAAMAAYRAS